MGFSTQAVQNLRRRKNLMNRKSILNIRESNPTIIPFCGAKIMSIPTLLSPQWPKITCVLLVHPLLVKELSLLRRIQYQTTGHPFETRLFKLYNALEARLNMNKR
jgi:hypothetical protein